jgi:hypothetical protein
MHIKEREYKNLDLLNSDSVGSMASFREHRNESSASIKADIILTTW